ncbi:MAG TPA: acylphosphatase [Noviherbaspirillum sp.]|nr:acylphosphatase [Noviherbaspirillum sp.]
MAKHLLIVGLVQGVGYRASFEAQARALKLAGWVRNRADGSVEAAVRGAPDAIDGIITWSQRGPAAARVREVAIADIDDASIPEERFEVLPTK